MCDAELVRKLEALNALLASDRRAVTAVHGPNITRSSALRIDLPREMGDDGEYAGEMKLWLACERGIMMNSVLYRL